MPRPESYFVVSNPAPQPGGSLNVLFAGESQTRPGHKLGPRVYDFYLIHYIVAGKGIFSSHGAEVELSAGDSFVIEPERLVSYASDAEEPWHYCWIAFTGSQAAQLVQQIGLSPQRPVIHAGRSRHIPLLFRLIQNALRAKKAAGALKAAGYLHLLFADYCDVLGAADRDAAAAEAKDATLVQQAIHYLSTQYAEPVTMERMADSLGYNRAYLSRLFKKHTGTTPVTFLLHLRIEKARLLLRERLELTVEQIAASVGFQDSLYFSKQFRRLYGMPPTEYRKSFYS